MSVYVGFIGPTNNLASPSVDSEETRNWFLEMSAPGTGKAPAWLAPVPGLEPFVVLNDGPVRALFSQDGRCFAVGATGFYEINSTHTASLIGTVALDGRPATICSNGSAGHQLFITSGGLGYTFDLITNLLTPITDPNFPNPCTMGCFIDGYFLALQGQSNTFYWSSLEDGTTWNALDVAQLSQSSDYILSMFPVYGQLWLLGSKTGVVWADIGGATIFAPIPGSLMQVGTRAAFSFWVGDNASFWLGGNDQGDGIVYRGTGVGSAPTRISTHAIEYRLSQSNRLADTLGWGYQENGHTFYSLLVPDLDTTYTYDAATQQWHSRDLWDPVALVTIPDVVRCHTFCFGQHLVGDRESGAVYVQDYNLATTTLVQMGSG